jgi:MarC family membrane protein
MVGVMVASAASSADTHWSAPAALHTKAMDLGCTIGEATATPMDNASHTNIQRTMARWLRSVSRKPMAPDYDAPPARALCRAAILLPCPETPGHCPMMNYTFASATILLILITDPIGNIPIFANALKYVAPERRARVILREILIAFALLLTFMFVGESFLRIMNLSELSLQIGGGVILFLIALRMVFPPASAAESEIKTEPLIVPLAIPAVAGPSALATVLLLVSQQPDRRLEWIGALCVTMLVSAVVLVSAERIQRIIGDRLVVAAERLMGLVLVSVAIEMMLRGIKTFVQQVAAAS